MGTRRPLDAEFRGALLTRGFQPIRTVTLLAEVVLEVKTTAHSEAESSMKQQLLEPPIFEINATFFNLNIVTGSTLVLGRTLIGQLVYTRCLRQMNAFIRRGFFVEARGMHAMNENPARAANSLDTADACVSSASGMRKDASWPISHRICSRVFDTRTNKV